MIFFYKKEKKSKGQCFVPMDKIDRKRTYVLPCTKERIHFGIDNWCWRDVWLTIWQLLLDRPMMQYEEQCCLSEWMNEWKKDKKMINDSFFVRWLSIINHTNLRCCIDIGTAWKKLLNDVDMALPVKQKREKETLNIVSQCINSKQTLMPNEVHLIHSKMKLMKINKSFNEKINIEHTALLVLISMDDRRYSKTFSRFPARAARKKPELPSD